MTTSGTTAFNMSIDEIIIEAYKKLGNQPIGAEELRTARTALNLLFIDMTNRGSALSNVVKKTVPLSADQATITLTNAEVDILDIVVTDIISDTSYPLNRYSMSEFLRIPSKNVKARPSVYSVNRNKEDINVNFWPIPDRDNAYTIDYYITLKIEDVIAYTDNVDLPSRYLNAVIYGLSVFLCDYRTDIDPNRQASLENKYEIFIQRAMDEDAERVPMMITPYAYTQQYR